ncbi:hypothetical protein [Sulfoacidibacillus thermotolerans]|uniref:Histidine kinase N-terminal 7TM region domain-containing protein n=1 Tax=Sulfoacidibacillus thermotolerans TaxID=1765684 RepID=A0A2U3D830_SULT2|nr:hypothetical protein [Sulfoacidibacillus thermotolerans]PWI57432.1 hypothetical protein BM613_08905 [Sulfoacidibacillus thermotolerans]
MSLLDVTYILLFLTSLFGAVLFFGFTFRRQIRYPLFVVSSHVIFASATWALFSISLVRHLFRFASHPDHFTAVLYLLLGYAIYTFTYLLGVYFFFRYDAKRKHVRLQSIALHLTLAGLTFIFVTSSYIVVALTPVHALPAGKLGTNSPLWYLVHRDQILHSHSSSSSSNRSPY